MPASHQYLLTVLSIWWAIGQLTGSLVCEVDIAVLFNNHPFVGCVAINHEFFLSSCTCFMPVI